MHARTHTRAMRKRHVHVRARNHVLARMHVHEPYIMHVRMYSPAPGRPGRPAARTGGDDASGLSSAKIVKKCSLE